MAVGHDSSYADCDGYDPLHRNSSNDGAPGECVLTAAAANRGMYSCAAIRFQTPQGSPRHGVRAVLDRANAEFLGWAFARPAIALKYAREIGWARPDEAEGYRHRRSAWGRGIVTRSAVRLH